jgi:hypothetical protein
MRQVETPTSWDLCERAVEERAPPDESIIRCLIIRQPQTYSSAVLQHAEKTCQVLAPRKCGQTQSNKQLGITVDASGTRTCMCRHQVHLHWMAAC